MHLFSLYLQRLFVRFGFFGRGTEAENVNLSVDSDEVSKNFIWASLGQEKSMCDSGYLTYPKFLPPTLNFYSKL